jgi:hypothetical protein
MAVGSNRLRWRLSDGFLRLKDPSRSISGLVRWAESFVFPISGLSKDLGLCDVRTYSSIRSIRTYHKLF